jgi:hypothetical protein
MNLTLHIGAHRCATTTFQSYLRANSDRLLADGVGFWGPRRTRAGLFRGIQPGPQIATGRDLHRRAIGLIGLQCTQSRDLGLKHLVVTDENMMGTMRSNLRLAELYCGVGERMARFAEAFDGHVTDVVVNIRSLDRYWASALGYGLMAGRGVPTSAALARIAYNPRGWRDVITDIACAIPAARLHVMPFETFAGRPDAQLTAMIGTPAPRTHARLWKNATPLLPELRAMLGATEGALPEGPGRWQPFDAAQVATLKELYADDLMWLIAGADGLAQIAPDPEKTEAGITLPVTDMTRGRRYDSQERHVARAR